MNKYVYENKRYGVYSRRGLIPHQVSIDERPDIVEARFRFGDWELDTVIGKNHKQVDNAMNKLNNRPRKCLGFKTPN